MKENETCGTCCRDGRYEKCIQNFGQKNLKVRDHLENLVVDGKIILK